MDYNILNMILAIAGILIIGLLIPILKRYKTKEEWEEVINNADIAVKAAEQIFKVGDNEAKYSYVDNVLKQTFPRLSTAERQMLIESTINEMNKFKRELFS